MSKSEKSDKKHPYNDPGYPPYPPEEDIYSREEEEKDKNPENPRQERQEKELNPDEVKRYPEDPDPDEGALEEAADEDLKNTGQRMGQGLDVPGSELDDEEEDIGEEDEENNYYSLGGEKDPEDNRDYSS